MREWDDEQNNLGVAVCTHMLHLAMLEQLTHVTLFTRPPGFTSATSSLTVGVSGAGEVGILT